MRAAMKRSLSFWTVGVLILYCGTLPAQVNAVYVQSNIAANGQNSVIGFSNDGTGKLTALPGSPYLTNGTGWMVPTGTQLGFQADDDQQIIVNKAGSLLFTVNGHSNSVSSFTINEDASLTLNGSPLSSAGSQPASLGLFDGVLSDGGSLLAVVNKSSDATQRNAVPPNIVTMTVGTTGVLTPNQGSKIGLPTGSSPSQVSVGAGNLAFVEQFMSSPAQISAYRVRSNGSFDFLGAQIVPFEGGMFLGQVVDAYPTLLYAGVPSNNAIAVYSFGPKSGNLTYLRTVATPGLLACWLALNSTRTRLYAAETASNTIAVFDLSNPRVPVVLQDLALTSTGNGGPWNLAVDPTDKFLYVITGTALHVLNIQSGGTLNETLTPVNLPVPAGTLPYGLATVIK